MIGRNSRWFQIAVGRSAKYVRTCHACSISQIHRHIFTLVWRQDAVNGNFPEGDAFPTRQRSMNGTLLQANLSAGQNELWQIAALTI